MNWQDKRVKFVALALAVLLVAIGARIFMNVTSSRERAKKATEGRAIAVPTGFAARQTINPVLTFAGNLDPVWQAKLAPKTAGRIKSILVKEGDYVEAGTVLAELDASELDAAVSAAMMGEPCDRLGAASTSSTRAHPPSHTRRTQAKSRQPHARKASSAHRSTSLRIA